MRVLVTGATGFVGQVLVRRLAACGHEPILVTRGGEDAPNTIHWNLGHEPAPASLPNRLDAIVHAAQSRNHRVSLGNCQEMFAVNTASAFMLLDYAARADVSRVCLLSTGTVYDPFEQGLDEGARLAPTSMLGATKLAAEVIAGPFARLFPISILRIFTPYGPGQKSRLIPDLIRRVGEGVDVQLAADGQGARLAPIYVDDLCAIIAASLDEQWSGTLNVASPHATNIREISEMLGGLMGKSPSFEIGTGSAVDLVPPIHKLRSRVDLDTLVPLKEGLTRTVAAMR